MTHPDERQAALLVAAALRRDALAHEGGDRRSIGDRYDDTYAEILRLCDGCPASIGAAMTFWDWWVDARNHDWHYYEGIRPEDWPRLARHVADALEGAQPIRDPVLLGHFARGARPGLWQRCLRFFRGRRDSK